MTDRDWFREFEQRARAGGDPLRLRLVEILYEADQHRETSPDLTLSLIDEGRSLARRLDEPWWALFYDDRRAGALMKYKGDVRAGLELAVRNALELRKPIYDQFPWRFRVHDHLVVGYLNTDPAGYADEIRQALDWLEKDIPLDGSPKYLILARRRWLVSELGRLDEAEALARQSLAMAAGDPDQRTGRSHAVFCYSHLCEIAWQRRDWPALEGLATTGEELNREVGHLLEQAEFSMWQALLARRAKREDRARRHFNLATRRVAQLGMPPDHIYFDATCAYHEQGGEIEQALAARGRELATLAGTGRWACEVRCRTERCLLLRRLGRPAEGELADARAAAAKLRRRGPALERLAGIDRQSGGPVP
jgi:hypothetical protein